MNTKVNATSPGSRSVTAQILFHPGTCAFQGVMIVPATAALTGAIQVDTPSNWKPPVKTAVNTWKITNNAIAAPTGGIVLGGQMRAMDKTTTMTVKVLANGNLYLKVTGMAPTGSGSTKASFEIETGTSGLAPALVP